MNKIEQMKKRNILLVIDIETTNFLNKHGKIVEVGISSINFKTLEILPIFDIVVKEKGFSHKDKDPPNGWIFRNSDLTIEDCFRAQSLSNYIFLFNLIFDTYPVTAYNKKFDFDFLRSRKIKIPYESLDPMICATSFLKLPPTEKMKFAGYGDQYKWPSVQEVWNRIMDTNCIEPHRAGKDSLMEAAIILKLYLKGIYEFDISKQES